MKTVQIIFHVSFYETMFTSHKISLCFVEESEGAVDAHGIELMFGSLTASEYCGGA